MKIEFPSGWSAKRHHVRKDELHVTYKIEDRTVYSWIVPVHWQEDEEFSALETLSLIRKYAEQANNRLNVFLQHIERSCEN